MIKKGILLIENDWRFTEFMAESAKKEGLTLDQASDGMEAVQFLQREKRKYVCILLDGKFPIWNPTPKVPSELEEFGTLHEKDNPTKLTGLTLLRYLREKKWQKDGVLWVLTSTTFNSYLNEELKDW